MDLINGEHTRILECSTEEKAKIKEEVKKELKQKDGERLPLNVLINSSILFPFMGGVYNRPK